MIVGPHQLAVGVEKVDEHCVVFRETRRGWRNDEAVSHLDRHADGRVRSGERD
jgi:hypothetical protein